MNPTAAIIQPGTRVRITAYIYNSLDRRLKFQGKFGTVTEFRATHLTEPDFMGPLPPYKVQVGKHDLWLNANEFEVA